MIFITRFLLSFAFPFFLLKTPIRSRWKLKEASPDLPFFNQELSPAEKTLAHMLLSNSEVKKSMIADILRDELSVKSLQLLERRHWLNDEIINGFLKLVQLKFPQVFIFSSFFWSKLASAGYESVAPWTQKKKINIFKDFEIVLFPMHVNENHWCLGYVDMRDFTVSIFDSQAEGKGSLHKQQSKKIISYLQSEFRNVFSDIRVPGWKIILQGDSLPQQLNENDCGVFVCLYGTFLSAGYLPHFIKKYHILNMRKRIVISLCKGAL